MSSNHRSADARPRRCKYLARNSWQRCCEQCQRTSNYPPSGTDSGRAKKLLGLFKTKSEQRKSTQQTQLLSEQKKTSLSFLLGKRKRGERLYSYRFRQCCPCALGV